MEDAAIREGFADLRPGGDYDPLYQSALCRQKADWLIGINASRLFSVLYHRTLNVGRVQTPTLAMLADRDSKIVLFRNHTLGLVHQIQSSAPYHGPFGVALDGSPDFETIAAAYRVPCIQVGDEDHLDEALDRFLGTQGSCLLICEVHPDVGTND